ncbi:B12-binding domain-containing radical SAM protein [bacterium]|nr:B12-binding domain-containing radical SAM protein [bacterium]
MNVLLVKPWGDAFNWYHSHMLGLAYVAGYVRGQGHKVEILDAAFHRMGAGDLLSEITQRKCDVVGVTAMTHEMVRAKEIFEVVKENKPSIHTILGGPHTSARPEETLKEIPQLDFSIAGEGEVPFTELLAQLDGTCDFEKIKGLAFRRNGDTHFNGRQSDFLDLKTIPQPAVDLYYKKDWFKTHPDSEYRLFASRGCPFKCGYCMRVLGDRVRWRDPEAVVEEWEKAVRYYGAEKVFLHDEIFLYKNETTHQILDAILRTNIPQISYFNCMTHPKLVDEELLEKAKRANCNLICIGVESGNNRVLKNSGRNYKIEEADQAVQKIKRAGIKPFTFFILGHPGETHKSIWDTIRAAVRINPFEIGLGVMVPYPGTKIYDYASEGKFGYKLNLEKDWDAYDRYGGSALKIKRLPRRVLMIYQIIGYLSFFLMNGKFRGMFNYLKPKIGAVVRLLSGKGLSEDSELGNSKTGSAYHRTLPKSQPNN